MTDRLPLLTAIVALLASVGGCDPASPANAPSPGGGAAPSASTSVPLLPTESSAAEPSPVASLPEPDASGYVETTFDDVKFEMTKTELFDRAMLTPKINALLGKKIRIRGYMYPTLRKKGLTRFVLVRDNLECCFGPGAALFDCILVTMAPDRTAEYSIRQIAVEGTLRLEELPGGPNGRPLAIYQMVGDSAK